MISFGYAPRLVTSLLLLLFLLLVPACSPPESERQTTTDPTAAPQPNPQRNAYFGDLHIHTLYSFDAFLFATRATPDDAYRFARGETLQHPAGFPMKLDRPLDFYAVTDHAVFLGILPAMADPATELSRLPVAQQLTAAKTAEERRAAFQGIRPYLRDGAHSEILDMDVVRSAWQEIVEAAERHNDPGHFTTFIGYEYTSGPESQNLHRNVIFRGSRAPEAPFSRLDSPNPEDLWTWLDNLRDEGIEGLAIPHNSNGSNGQMFRLETFDGEPLDAMAAQKRMRNEPLVEITQVKGTSDTHPLLSPNDEWAEFEIFPYRIATWIPSDIPGSYVRDAYLNGLKMEEEQGFNPFRFGLIGSSDTHNAATSVDESDYWSKVGLLDGTPRRRGSVPLERPAGEEADPEGQDTYARTYYNLWGASGLAGVWAEENTRDSIYEALRRKETFATSGPRIQLRFFAGYDYPEDLAGDPERIARAYRDGVPMGADLLRDGERSPRFFVWAARDAMAAPLARLQVIKGWIEDGESREQVFDVACSDDLEVDPDTHRCPDNGARVDLADCSISADAGAGELSALWRDPSFRPDRRAFYYVRVLENPTCRWSTWDALRAGVDPHPHLPATIQERAWSSPIWYVPDEAP